MEGGIHLYVTHLRWLLHKTDAPAGPVCKQMFLLRHGRHRHNVLFVPGGEAPTPARARVPAEAPVGHRPAQRPQRSSPQRGRTVPSALTLSAGTSWAGPGKPGMLKAWSSRAAHSASWWLTAGAFSCPLSSLKSLLKKPESLGLEGAAPPDSGGRGAGPGVAARPWWSAGVRPGVLSGPGPRAAAGRRAMLSLAPLSPRAPAELTSGCPGARGGSDESSPRSPVRPGTGRERGKKKCDLAAGARGLASFPGFFLLAAATALVSTVLGEEAATLSSWTLIPKSTANTNTHSRYSAQPREEMQVWATDNTAAHTNATAHTGWGCRLQSRGWLSAVPGPCASRERGTEGPEEEAVVGKSTPGAASPRLRLRTSCVSAGTPETHTLTLSPGRQEQVGAWAPCPEEVAQPWVSWHLGWILC